ncbi:unnamed protein product [Leptidea sinapis]|uniref:Uncharacterized protein n=1 Tax=Leptidea sinapis TaxID=189913 RepID=A0A5E4PXF3_9NEOP|nr:unnamed protein product [Leptidea sinapis]
MVINVYKYVKENWPSNEYPYKTEINKIIDFGNWHSICKVDDFDKSVIRKKKSQFLFKWPITNNSQDFSGSQ